MPALRVTLRTEGDMLVRIGGFSLATAKLRGNRLDLEVGIQRDAEGRIVPVAFMDDDFLDVDVHWTAAVAAGVLSFGVLTLGAAGVAELVEENKSSEIRDALLEAVEGIAGSIRGPWR